MSRQRKLPACGSGAGLNLAILLGPAHPGNLGLHRATYSTFVYLHFITAVEKVYKEKTLYQLVCILEFLYKGWEQGDTPREELNPQHI